MSNSTQYAALTRLLTLNNRVHDLEHLLGQVNLKVLGDGLESHFATIGPNQIAEMQEEMDREVRASLTTCWLGIPGWPDQ